MVFVFMSVQEVIKAMGFLDYEGLKLYDENIKKFISTIDIPDPINPDDFQSKIKGTGIAFVINDQTFTSPEFTYGENGFQTPNVRLPHGIKTLIELFDPELGSVPIITNKSSEFHFHGEADSVPYTGLTGCNAAGKILVSTGSSWELQSLGNVALDPNAYLPLSGGQMLGVIDFMDNGGDQNLLTLEEVYPLFSINRDTSTLSINGLGTFNTVKIGSSIHASKFMINDYCGMYHNGDKLIIDSSDDVEITAQSLFVNYISSNGFFVLKSDGSSYSDDYVILAGGGVKPLSEITPNLSGYLRLSGGTMSGDILPDNHAPAIGRDFAIEPGVTPPTYRSLGSENSYFNKIYAREFKGLADNALKLYTYGTGFHQQHIPYAVTVGDASTPVYFKDGVPVACNGTLPTDQQINNWNLAYGWGDHSKAGYVTSSGVTAVYVGDGLYLEGLDEQHPTSLSSITSEGRITLKLGNDTQSDYYSNSDYEPVEERQYGVGLDAGGDLSVNVPWTDTYHKHTAGTGISISNATANGDSSHNVTISLLKATTSAIGGIKIGYSKNGQNYPVELNTEGQAYVNVPWNDAPQQSLDGYLTIAAAEEAYVKKVGDTMTGALSATAFYETSDIRKKEIKSDLSLDKCYDLIDKCQTVIYSLKGQTKEQVGMIAQEIEEFFPEVVATDEEGFKSLAYDRLVVICFKVLKDVIKRLEKLES